MPRGGAVRLTGDSVVGTSGFPIRVYSVNMLSGGTAGDLELRNGTTAADPVWIAETGVSNAGKTVEYTSNGMFFPNGCFYDHDANFTQVTISYEVMTPQP